MPDTRDWNAVNRPIIAEFRANGGKVAGRAQPLILLTTTGAKSGLPRVTPLNYSVDDGRIVVIASKGGSPTHPDWYHNLAADPNATLEIGTERYAVRARVAEGEEHERLFRQQAAVMPFFATYQKNTQRRIPVVILERMEPSGT